MMELRVEDVSITLSKKHILNSVSVKADGKNFVGIIGPNGSGKTTLLKCVYRVLRPDAGDIYFDEQRALSLSAKAAAQKIAVVSQHNYYNFDFTVEEVVSLGRSPHKKNMQADTKEDHEIVADAMRRVGMSEYRDRIFSTLSGGEQQRVILARALCQCPQCLILDEPTNHLDIKYQFQLLNIVKSLGIPVVAAMHDLNIALLYCDYLYILKEGSLVAEGLPHVVLTPQLIWDVYGVKATIQTRADNKLIISYQP